MKTENKKRAFGFSEFAEMFSISIDSAKRLWKTGDLATITVGGRRLIPLSEVDRVSREGVGTPRKRKAQVAGNEMPSVGQTRPGRCDRRAQ